MPIIHNISPTCMVKYIQALYRHFTDRQTQSLQRVAACCWAVFTIHHGYLCLSWR